MSTAAGPDGADNGLVFALDAGNNRSYPGSGTSWYDTTGNTTLTLANGPTYSSLDSGYIIFDGTNDYGNVTIPSTTVNCAEIWVFLTSRIGQDADVLTTTGYQCASFSYEPGGAYGGGYDGFTLGSWTGAATNETIGYFYNGSSFRYIIDVISAGWHQIGLNWNSTSSAYDIYVDGTIRTTYSGTYFPNISQFSTTRVTVGSSTGSGANQYFFNGKVAGARLWNRSLTAAEISQNYNSLRSRYISPSIIPEGLRMNLDAGNTASYSGSGTTWTDISTFGNNGTLTNGPTYNGSNAGTIVFDGTNDIVTTSCVPTSTFTWSVWFKTNVLASGYRNIISVPTNSYMLMLLDTSVNRMGFWSSDGMGGGDLGVTSLSTNTWYNAVFVREDNSTTNGYKAYLNGVYKGASNTSTWSSSDTISIGGRTDTSQYLNGNVAQVAIYNKALSQLEISQNFNALRQRFGI